MRDLKKYASKKIDKTIRTNFVNTLMIAIIQTQEASQAIAFPVPAIVQPSLTCRS